jgi:hypothetical protein
MSEANDELDPRPAASGSGSSAVPAVGRQAGTAQAADPGAHGSAAEARRSRRAADAPVDAESAAPERVSLARARDRQALRTYRALAEHSLPSDATSYDAMPTRRQLRLQQQEAQAARAAAAAGGSDDGGSAPTAQADPAGTGPAAAGATPAAAAQARLQAGPQPADQPMDQPVDQSPGLPAAREGGRRDRRRRLGPEEAPGQGGPDQPGAGPDLSVEQALAARQEIVGQAVDQVAMIEGRKGNDPFAVDLGILAQQKALAERAAVLNSRAQKMQQLSEENSQRRPQANDPTTAHNLSIVAQPEYVKVPGVDRPVLKAPTTSHIPVIRPAAPAAPGGPAAPRSRVLEQAETIARNHGRPTADGATPVRARSAHGLDPLDAMTAGLARVRRMKYLQFSILGLGVLALLAGILMIVSGLGG